MRSILLTTQEEERLNHGDPLLWLTYLKIKKHMNAKTHITGNDNRFSYTELAQALTLKGYGDKMQSVTPRQARYHVKRLIELGLLTRLSRRGAKKIVLKHCFAGIPSAPQAHLMTQSASVKIPSTVDLNTHRPTSPKKKDSTSTKQANKDATIQQLFRYWCDVHEHPKARLTPKAHAALARALSLGYDMAACQCAIEGCRKSAFHQGQNPQQQRYDSLSLIFRDAEHIEQFIQLNKPRLLPPIQNTRTPKPPRNGLDVLIEAFDANYGEQLGRKNPFMPPATKAEWQRSDNNVSDDQTNLTDKKRLIHSTGE
jgi:hypothetical protein